MKTALVVGLVINTTLTAVAFQDEPTQSRTDKLGDPLEEHVLHRFGTRRFQHPSSVLEVCLSADGQSVITYGRDTVIGWDASSGKQLWNVERGQRARQAPRFGTGYGIRVMARAAETGEIVSIRTDQHIPLWNPRTGESVGLNLAGADEDAKSIDISPDGQLIAIGGPGTLAVFTRSGERLFEQTNNPEVDIEQAVGEGGRDRLAFPGEFSYGRFSPNGSLIALVNSQKPMTIQLLEARTGKPVREIRTSDRVVRFVFSPNSKTIAATERDSAIRLYDTAAAARVWERKLTPAQNAESYASAIDFHPDGSQIAVGAVLGPDRSVRVLDAGTGRETARLEYPGWRPWTLHYSADGTSLVASGWDGTVHRWKTTQPPQLVSLPGGVRATSTCAIAGNGGLLAFEDSDWQIHIAEQQSGDVVRKLSIPGIDWSSFRFNPDGTLLATAGVDKTHIHLVIWDVAHGKETHHWSWETGRDPHSTVYSLSFSGSQIAANVFRQSTAYIWDLESGRQTVSVRHPNVFGASLRDGKLVTVGWDRRIAEWDSTTGKPTRTLITGTLQPNGAAGPGGDRRNYSVRLSHDRSLMAVSDMTRSIRLYDRDWNEMVVIPRAGGSQRPLAMSRNGLWVSYASIDLNVYDVMSGDAVFQVTGHRQGIDTIEFGPRDRTVLTGADDGICNLWKFPSRTSNLDDARLFASLIGTNGKLAFAVFRQLDSDPARAVKLLEGHLSPFAEKDVSAAAVRRQIIAIGSGKEALVEQARTKLFELGPGVLPFLRNELASGKLSDAKKTELAGLSFLIHRRYRRASMLLAQLEGRDAAALMSRLTASSKSKHSAAFFEEAQEYRETLDH